MRNPNGKLSAPRSFLRENVPLSPSSTPPWTPAKWPTAPLNAGSGGPGPGISQIVLDLSQLPPAAPGLLIAPGTGLIFASSYNTSTSPAVSSPTDAVTLSYDPASGRSDPITITPGWIGNNFSWNFAYLTWTQTAYPTRTIIQYSNSPGTTAEDNGAQ